MQGNRVGFSRSDLLVALALVTLTVGVTLPAIQKVRATETKATCVDHLRKIAKGALSFADTHEGTLPRDSVSVPRWSWNVEILPFVGEEKLFRRFDVGKNWWAGDNRGVAATPLSVFQCPANATRGRMVTTMDPDGGKEFEAAPTDYVGSAGAYYRNNQQENLFPGAMHHRQITARIKQSNIQDGLANTLLVVEMADKPNRWNADRRAEDRSGKAQMPALSGQWAAPNWNHLRSYSADGRTPFGPCAVNCSNGASIYGFHAKGANCLFVDGSVRFLREGMSQEMLIALVSIAGGEVIGPNDF